MSHPLPSSMIEAVSKNGILTHAYMHLKKSLNLSGCRHCYQWRISHFSPTLHYCGNQTQSSNNCLKYCRRVPCRPVTLKTVAPTEILHFFIYTSLLVNGTNHFLRLQSFCCHCLFLFAFRVFVELICGFVLFF